MLRTSRPHQPAQLAFSHLASQPTPLSQATSSSSNFRPSHCLHPSQDNRHRHPLGLESYLKRQRHSRHLPQHHLPDHHRPTTDQARPRPFLRRLRRRPRRSSTFHQPITPRPLGLRRILPTHPASRREPQTLHLLFLVRDRDPASQRRNLQRWLHVLCRLASRHQIPQCLPWRS